MKLMMLKQSSSRNLRAKRLKVKHAIWVFVIVAISIWFLYQVKQLYNKKAPIQVYENGENEYQILKIGRKELKPRIDEEVELEDEESKVTENEREESIDGDEEVDDKEKSEESEHDQLQELIDEDDKDR